MVPGNDILGLFHSKNGRSRFCSFFLGLVGLAMIRLGLAIPGLVVLGLVLEHCQ
jgi:hypothetical protein